MGRKFGKSKKIVKYVPQFTMNELVLAKMKGFPPWPALVTDITPTGYWVYFFGTHNRQI